MPAEAKEQEEQKDAVKSAEEELERERKKERKKRAAVEVSQTFTTASVWLSHVSSSKYKYTEHPAEECNGFNAHGS